MTYEQFKASQGPTIQEIDSDLADVSDVTLERYAREFDPAQIGSKSWEALPIEQRKAMRANNELARRQHEKERADAKAADDARIEEQQNAANQARIADYKARARGAWIGDQKSFDSAWPTLLQQWQIDQVNATLDRTKAEVRARMMDF